MLQRMILLFICLGYLAFGNNENIFGIGMNLGLFYYKMNEINDFNMNRLDGSVRAISWPMSPVYTGNKDNRLLFSIFFTYKIPNKNVCLKLDLDYYNDKAEATIFDGRNSLIHILFRRSIIHIETYPLTLSGLYLFNLTRTFQVLAGVGLGYYYSRLNGSWDDQLGYFSPGGNEEWSGGNLGYHLELNVEFPLFDRVNFDLGMKYRIIKIKEFKDSHNHILKIYSFKDNKEINVLYNLTGIQITAGFILYLF